MGAMKDFYRRIRQGGDDAIAAVEEYVAEQERLVAQVESMLQRACDRHWKEWVPVTERLPEIGLSVIGVGGESSPREMWLDLNHQWHMADGSEVDLVTHWMPLPEPPEVK